MCIRDRLYVLSRRGMFRRPPELISLHMYLLPVQNCTSLVTRCPFLAGGMSVLFHVVWIVCMFIPWVHIFTLQNALTSYTPVERLRKKQRYILTRKRGDPYITTKNVCEFNGCTNRRAMYDHHQLCVPGVVDLSLIHI